jgi:hypothetical protein
MYLYLYWCSGIQYQVDKDEEKHVILCRVALGSVERLFLECDQTNSSNEGYDTASDNPNNPKWYAVWADDINKRILPVCVVSCKTSAIQAAGNCHTSYEFLCSVCHTLVKWFYPP